MLIEKLKQYIKKIDFEDGQPFVTVSFNKDWKILPNKNFLVQSNETLHLIASNKPNTQLDVLLSYIQQIVEFNLEIIAKKEWVYKMSQKLKLMASELSLEELNNYDLVNTVGVIDDPKSVFDDMLVEYEPREIKNSYTNIEPDYEEINQPVQEDIPYHILAEMERNNQINQEQPIRHQEMGWSMEREADYEE